MSRQPDDRWIWVNHWERFQHYSDRNPKWIKNYLELLGDEAYLELSSHRRGLLHGVWMAFASSRGRLRADTRTISARLRIRVTTPDIESLNQAGWIDILASTALAQRLQDAPLTLALARADARSREEELDKEGVSSSTSIEDPAPPKRRRRRATPNGARPAHAWQDVDRLTQDDIIAALPAPPP